MSEIKLYDTGPNRTRGDKQIPEMLYFSKETRKILLKGNQICRRAFPPAKKLVAMDPAAGIRRDLLEIAHERQCTWRPQPMTDTLGGIQGAEAVALRIVRPNLTPSAAGQQVVEDGLDIFVGVLARGHRDDGRSQSNPPTAICI